MVNTRQINELTTRIQHYVRLIKEKRNIETAEPFSVSIDNRVNHNNDLRTNINKLNGENKFNIQKLNTTSDTSAPTEYASEAYEHLSELDKKRRVVIDYMHKNNRNYDVNV